MFETEVRFDDLPVLVDSRGFRYGSVDCVVDVFFTPDGEWSVVSIFMNGWDSRGSSLNLSNLCHPASLDIAQESSREEVHRSIAELKVGEPIFEQLLTVLYSPVFSATIQDGVDRELESLGYRVTLGEYADERLTARELGVGRHGNHGFVDCSSSST